MRSATSPPAALPLSRRRPNPELKEIIHDLDTAIMNKRDTVMVFINEPGNMGALRIDVFLRKPTSSPGVVTYSYCLVAGNQQALRKKLKSANLTNQQISEILKDDGKSSIVNAQLGAVGRVSGAYAVSKIRQDR
jgi:hypothetical protein